MSWINVWLHFVWSTKDRMPFLREEIRVAIFEHIRQNAKEKGIYIDFINGYLDHVHCLISLKPDQTLETIMRLIKGESSHWINQQNLIKSKFAWQDEYFVASVSESNVPSVRKYIASQEEHHSMVSFGEEFEKFLIRAGFHRFRD